MPDDDVRETPAVVTGAVSIGTVPLPFLAVYAVLFLVHGSLHPVNPPDVTSSTTGEFLSGVLAAGLFVVLTVALIWFLNGRRRWPYAVLELAILATAVYFVTDYTKGGRVVSIVVIVATLASLILAFAPDSWTHVERRVPSQVRRLYGGFDSRRVGRHAATTTGDAHVGR